MLETLVLSQFDAISIAVHANLLLDSLQRCAFGCVWTALGVCLDCALHLSMRTWGFNRVASASLHLSMCTWGCNRVAGARLRMHGSPLRACCTPFRFLGAGGGGQEAGFHAVAGGCRNRLCVHGRTGEAELTGLADPVRPAVAGAAAGSVPCRRRSWCRRRSPPPARGASAAAPAPSPWPHGEHCPHAAPCPPAPCIAHAVHQCNVCSHAASCAVSPPPPTAAPHMHGAPQPSGLPFSPSSWLCLVSETQRVRVSRGALHHAPWLLYMGGANAPAPTEVCFRRGAGALHHAPWLPYMGGEPMPQCPLKCAFVMAHAVLQQVVSGCFIHGGSQRPSAH